MQSEHNDHAVNADLAAPEGMSKPWKNNPIIPQATYRPQAGTLRFNSGELSELGASRPQAEPWPSTTAPRQHRTHKKAPTREILAGAVSGRHHHHHHRGRGRGGGPYRVLKGNLLK